MSCSNLRLNCFDVARFTLFLCGTCVIPYILYQKIASTLKWTRKRPKSLTKHYETLLSGMCSMVMLWFLGNYEETYSMTTFIFTLVGMFLFGHIAEIARETHNHTLATINTWNSTMVIISISVTMVILFFARLHVQMAAKENMLQEYLTAAVVPVILLVFGLYSVHLENKGNKHKTNTTATEKTLLHLHHLHLFYVLAFFTRFPTFWSQVAAGLCIGASVHGISAFGFDSSFDPVL